MSMSMSMDQEELGGAESSGEIVKPLSAYHHFAKLRTSVIKEELLGAGQDASLGALTSTVAARWKSMSDNEKATYEQLALKDKERYERECIQRDAEVLRQQEERRKKNALTETDSKLRHSTNAQTTAVNSKVEVHRRKRELSEEEKLQIESKKQAKMAEESSIKQQHDNLKASKAAHAEARLQYLLAQSDIFAHFGADNVKKPVKERETKKKKGKSDIDDLDDDEKEMLAEEDDDEEDDSTNKSKVQAPILLKQPSIVVGGAMRAYQLEGLNWMIRLHANGINGILADEMGLGKTLQSISMVAYLYEFEKITGPHLVVVPKSTLSNWMNEFARWCPTLRTVRFHGDKDERAEIAQSVLRTARSSDERTWDVCITTYEVCNLEKGALAKIAWRYLIIDEAHRLKNEASQFSQLIRMMNTEHRLLLTGTPLQNNLHELWALLNFLLPDVFASSEQFDEWFNLDVDDTEAKQRMISQLHKILRPFMLRRLKSDVEKSLPPKTETILFTGLSVVQKNLYRQILLRDIDQLNAAPTSNSNNSRTAILNIVMQLRKCCNHPYLFPGIEDRTLDPLGEHLIANCGKMVLLDKLMKKLYARKHRVLLFSQMTRMLDILEDYCCSSGYSYCRIDGNTSYEEREDRIQSFNAPGSEVFCFLLSTRAGGLGINLQTADTVIIYDSDWNPQADLQAQDRCHRIGQKKPVNVYRLVTDETVEVKVVERAQQKLKLDAMIVQQGRLVDKEKKMSKDELLDTLRFGADKIFRSKDSSSITDDDIDMILEQGRKRTEEMTASLQVAEKGDLYDFSLDGGMGAQIFEGKDYSDRSLREKENNTNVFAGIAFIDLGKRERKTVVSYNETSSKARDDADKKPKMPRHLRLPRMDDWQFYNRARLNELQEEELRLFDELVERGEAPGPGNIAKLVLLPKELQEEKNKLLSEAFGDWNRFHYSSFIKAVSKHGRYQYEKISEDVGKPLENVKQYSSVFWSKGPTTFTTTEWERVTKLIEKGEKRLEEINRLSAATARLISLFKNPWEDLTFRNTGVQGRIFNAIEDRYLLCLTNLHGYGNWDRVRASIRRCERFRFDYYLLSCSAETLGKRCEILMRAAEKELHEIDKKQTANSNRNQIVSVNPDRNTTAVGNSKFDRLSEIVKQIEEEARKLTLVRAELQKTHKPEIEEDDDEDATHNSKEKESGNGRNQPRSVPDEYLPELCRIVANGGCDGIQKIITQFVELHPTVSRRQVEIKIGEIAVKQKRDGSGKQVWCLLDEYERLIREGKAESGKKQKSNTTPSEPTPSRSKGQKRSAKAIAKENENDSEAEDIGKASSPGTPSEDKKSKKHKSAFAFFVRAMRSTAEEELGPQVDTEVLKAKLLDMWRDLSDQDREQYLLKEAEAKSKSRK